MLILTIFKLALILQNLIFSKNQTQNFLKVHTNSYSLLSFTLCIFRALNKEIEIKLINIPI